MNNSKRPDLLLLKRFYFEAINNNYNLDDKNNLDKEALKLAMEKKNKEAVDKLIKL